MPRSTTKGRRRIEEGEFCRNCNRLKHDEKIFELEAENTILKARIDAIEDLAYHIVSKGDLMKAAINECVKAAEEILD